MLSGYTINTITGSDIWMVQIAFAFDGPGPTLNVDVCKKSQFLVARGNHRETLQKRKLTCTPGVLHKKDSTQEVSQYRCKKVTQRLQKRYPGMPLWLIRLSRAGVEGAAASCSLLRE